MTRLMGPVLGFRGVESTEDGDVWKVGVLIVAEEGEAPVLEAKGASVAAPVPLLEHGRRKAWRYDLAVTQTSKPQAIRYSVRGANHRFHVPPAGHPPRMSYASCNGFSDPKLMKSVKDKNERWKHLAQVHRSEPYHLLLMGGDQIYADPIWSTDEFEEWAEESLRDRLRAPFDKRMRKRAAAFYFGIYCRRWSQPEMARVMASIPTLMMWDDHDIFDGWGSYSDKENECPVFQGLFELANRSFGVFQRQTAPGVAAAGELPNQPGYTWGHVIGSVALLGLDLRSERSNAQVMGQKTWKAVIRWMDALPTTVKHLLVMSSIPVVYPDFSVIENALGVIPGRQELEDDLRDHWHSPPHKGERLRLIQRLLDVSQNGIRVTLLSGDVHVAAVGVIESTRDSGGGTHSNVVNQLTSSGIVHPPPPGIAVWGFEHLVSSSDEPLRGVKTRLMDLPGAGRKLVAARNWLAVEPDDVAADGTTRDRLWANWHIEGECSRKGGCETPYTKVIHPISKARP